MNQFEAKAINQAIHDFTLDKVFITKDTFTDFEDRLARITRFSYGEFDYRELLSALQGFVYKIRKDNEVK
jgi:hypothetical protein